MEGQVRAGASRWSICDHYVNNSSVGESSCLACEEGGFEGNGPKEKGILEQQVLESLHPH